MIIDLQGAAEAIGMGDRRRLTTKSYLTIALPMRLGIKHASALKEEFKQSNEKPTKGARRGVFEPKEVEAF